MDNIETKQLIIDILEKSLNGHIKTGSPLKIANIADAILTRTDLTKTFKEHEGKNIHNVLNNVKQSISLLKKEMEDEYNSCGTDEKLLKNFIKGKITAKEEDLEILNSK